MPPADPQPIVIEFTHTLDEAVRANGAVQKARSPWLDIIYVLLGAGILVIWSLDGDTRRSPLHPWILSTGLTLLTLPLWRPALMRFLVKRHFAKLASANKPMRWTITADTLHARSAVMESRIEWPAIIRVIELHDGFVLYTHPRIGQWVPKHGFKSEADIDRLRVMIEQRGIPFKK